MNNETKPDKKSRHKKTILPPLPPLIVLNAILLAVLGAVTFSQTVDAQQRARGDYMMAGGNVKGAQGSALYIIDTVNQELIAMTYLQNSKTLSGIGYRNLGADSRGR